MSNKDDLGRFAKETYEIYRQFVEAMKIGDEALKEIALKRLADTFGRHPKL